MPEQSRLNPGQKVAISLIEWYQRYFSPDHSPRKVLYPYGYCRFTPTCSQYGHDAIVKYGVLSGSVRAFLRILRCNSFFKGGYDPVP